MNIEAWCIAQKTPGLIHNKKPAKIKRDPLCGIFDQTAGLFVQNQSGAQREQEHDGVELLKGGQC